MKKLSLLLSLTGILSLCCPKSMYGQEEAKPNIIFIFADDLGYGDLACYGHPYMQTPNIDNLAAEGTQFKRFYATGVTCCPSRTGFMTSRHPASYEKYMAKHDFAGRPTITQLLKENGYVTGHVGKWHISGVKRPPNGTYGIDHLKVIGGAKEPKAGKDDDVFDEAIAFIEKYANGDKPFYLNLWGHISHYQVDPGERFPAHFKDVEVDKDEFGIHYQAKLAQSESLVPDVNVPFRNYLGEVWSLDLAVGRLLSKLEELGLSENTIVIFSSDQGPARNKRKPKNTTSNLLTANMLGSAGNLRGGKHEQYEGGVRIPFIIRYPGKVPAGKVNTRSILSALDWLPTLCSIAGISYNEEQFEGQDVSDIWFGSDLEIDRYLYWKTSSTNSTVSILHNNWKAHEDRRTRAYTLYNLAEDEEELHDVADQYPQILAELKAKAEAWKHTLPSRYIK